MRQICQGLQDVVGYCKQEVGGQQPAEAEHAVAQWQRDGKLSGKTSRESEGEFIILIITVEPFQERRAETSSNRKGGACMPVKLCAMPLKIQLESVSGNKIKP